MIEKYLHCLKNEIQYKQAEGKTKERKMEKQKNIFEGVDPQKILDVLTRVVSDQYGIEVTATLKKKPQKKGKKKA